MKWTLNLLLLVTISLLGSSCSILRIAKVKIKNQEWCGDKGPLGAYCFNTHNSSTRTIEPGVWNTIAVGPDYRFGKLCTDAGNFTDTTAVILKLCKVSKRCTYDAKKKIITFSDNVESFTVETKNLRKDLKNAEQL